MKVKVYVKSSAKVQEKYYEQVIAEAYAENEELFQKNRDLERQIVCMERDFQAMKKKLSDVCAERDNLEAAYKQVQASIGQIARNFEDTRKELESEVKRVCKENQELYAQLEDAHKRIDEQQKIIMDCSDTITTLRATAELRPQFSNLWQLLKETGMIVDTEGGIHNHE